MACDSAPPASSNPKTAETGQPGPTAELKPTQPTPAPAVPPLAPAPNPPGEAAYAHFDAAGQATRAVLAADLATAAPHLAWLSHHEYPQRLPVAWRPHATRLQLAARVLARAASPGEAARSLPALSAACGACHDALSERDFDTREHPTKHGDATLALLEGLSGRTESLFTSAAGLTATIAGQPEAGALAALREATARAEAAQTWIARTTAAEEVFGLCGSCHSALR